MIELRQSLVMDTDATERHPHGYEPPETRCARPGEPYRNVERRCGHGFLDGKNCYVCDPVARAQRADDWTIRRSKSHPFVVARRIKRRRAALAAIAAGHVTHQELAAALNTSSASASQTIRQLTRVGYLSLEPSGHVLTDRGRDFLAGGPE